MGTCLAQGSYRKRIPAADAEIGVAGDVAQVLFTVAEGFGYGVRVGWGAGSREGAIVGCYLFVDCRGVHWEGIRGTRGIALLF
jgi:hypothetical protein